MNPGDLIEWFSASGVAAGVSALVYFGLPRRVRMSERQRIGGIGASAVLTLISHSMLPGAVSAKVGMLGVAAVLVGICFVVRSRPGTDETTGRDDRATRSHRH